MGKIRRISAGFTVPELFAALALLFMLLIVASVLLRHQPYTTAHYEAEQRLNMATILQAINKYQSAHQGALPDGIGSSYAFIGTQDGQVDLCKALVPAYLHDIPLDSLTGAKAYRTADGSDPTEEQNAQACNAPNMVYMSGYAVAKDSKGHVSVAVLASDQKHVVMSLLQR